MPILFPLQPKNPARLLVPHRLPGAGTSLEITGTVRTSSGVAVSGCTVKLFRTSDDRLMATDVSDGTGVYRFTGLSAVETYYIVAYKSAMQYGTTPNTLMGS